MGQTLIADVDDEVRCIACYLLWYKALTVCDVGLLNQQWRSRQRECLSFADPP
jgi:hypothetical protein